jgi:hypothetical protein
MSKRIAKDFNLTKEQCLLDKVDWLVKDAEAWDSLCEWWTSLEFRARFDKARANQTSKLSVHHYDVDEHTRKAQRMV